MRTTCCAPVLVAILAASAATAQVTISITPQANQQAQLSVGLPFSADMAIRTVQHLAGGTSLSSEATGHVYRSSDGVERTDATAVSTDPANSEAASQMVYVLDPVKHTIIIMNSKLKTATLEHLPANAAITANFLGLKQLGDQNKITKLEDLTLTDLGKKTQGMLSLVGKRTTQTIPIGTVGNDKPLLITSDMWIDPDLKLVVDQTDQNPLTGERTFELTNIRGGEPDPTLFQIPEGYTVKETRLGMPGLVTPQANQAASEASQQTTQQIEAELNSPDPVVRNKAAADEATRSADVASGYVTLLAKVGNGGKTRLVASRAAMVAERAAAAAEMAAAAVESDASQATTASASGDGASVKNARDKAASDYSVLLAADNQLAKAAKDLADAAAGNAAFYARNPGNAAINDMGAQDSSAASRLLYVATKGGTAKHNAAKDNEAAAIKIAANETTAMNDANTIAGLDPSRNWHFQAAAKAEAEAQSAATSAAVGGSESAATAVAAAATAGEAADGTANPFAGAVESGAAAVARAASATISAQHAMDRLKTFK